MTGWEYGDWRFGPITIRGQYVSMKNGRKVVRIAGHSSLIKKEAALLWEKAAMIQVPRAKIPFMGPCALIGSFFYHDRRSDLDENLLKDMLQVKEPGKPYLGIIGNDNQIKCHETTWYLDRLNPRVIFELRELVEVNK